jgi:hypothetical protein
MNAHSVPNRGLVQFCAMLRDDPVYCERAAARVTAGHADHLIKLSIEEELKPRGKRQRVGTGRPYIVYPDHDADRNLKPDIHTEGDWKLWETYIRSREHRLAEEAEATKVIVTARSRFPVLDQLLQPGLARERFFRRWRGGKVGKTLEIMILRIAAIAEVQRKRRGLRIVLLGRFSGDPMSREHDSCGPTCRVRANREAQTSSARQRAGGRQPKPTTPSASPSVEVPTTRPSSVTDPGNNGERVIQIGDQEFVQDPDIGDGPEA